MTREKKRGLCVKGTVERRRRTESEGVADTTIGRQQWEAETDERYEESHTDASGGGGEAVRITELNSTPLVIPFKTSLQVNFH